jgi:hypothetical protein
VADRFRGPIDSGAGLSLTSGHESSDELEYIWTLQAIDRVVQDAPRVLTVGCVAALDTAVAQ